MAKFKVIDPAGGFYIGRRRFGQVFEAPDNFPEKWAEKVAEDAPAKPVKTKKPEPMTLAKGGEEAGVDHGDVDFA